MKTITIDEFQDLVAHEDWKQEQDHEITDRFEYPIVNGWDEESETPILTDITHVSGWLSLTSTRNGITITCTEMFSYDEYEPDTFSTGEDWAVDGIIVTDEYGDEMNAFLLCNNYLNNDFSNFDYSVFDIEQITDFDVDENSNMDTITLRIDNAPNIRFTGEMVASVASSDDMSAGSSYSGDRGRWTELILYKTKGGNFICHEIGHTRQQGERNRFKGKVCETLGEVKEFFGYRWLAKKLYIEAEIDDAVEVD